MAEKRIPHEHGADEKKWRELGRQNSQHQMHLICFITRLVPSLFEDALRLPLLYEPYWSPGLERRVSHTFCSLFSLQSRRRDNRNFRTQTKEQLGELKEPNREQEAIFEPLTGLGVTRQTQLKGQGTKVTAMADVMMLAEAMVLVMWRGRSRLCASSQVWLPNPNNPI